MMYDNKPMIATFADKKVVVRYTDDLLVREFRMPDRVVGAQVSGIGSSAMVTINMANGNWRLYKIDGSIVRMGKVR